MAVTIEFPPEVESRLKSETQDFAAEVRESAAVELFRRGKLSHFELSKVLGLDRFQTDAYLKRHNIFEGSLTMEDLEEESRMLKEVLDRNKPVSS